MMATPTPASLEAAATQLILLMAASAEAANPGAALLIEQAKSEALADPPGMENVLHKWFQWCFDQFGWVFADELPIAPIGYRIVVFPQLYLKEDSK